MSSINLSELESFVIDANKQLFSARTGIFYDSRCLLHQANYNHYESPKRLLKSFERLVNTGIWEQCQHLLFEGQMFGELSTFVRKYRENKAYTPSYSDISSDGTEEKKCNESMEQPLFTDSLVPSLERDLILRPIDNAPTKLTILADVSRILSATLQKNHGHDQVKNAIPMLVHKKQYVEETERIMYSDFGEDEVDSETEDDPDYYPDSKFIDEDSYINEFSWLAVETGTLGIIGLTQCILNGNIDTAYALIRPPGHHASLQASGGFCLFNNIAIAAEMVLKSHITSQTRRKRIVIVDYDVHHGNGTQDIFYDRDDVLFISIHRFDPGTFYPSSGACSEIGVDKGKGYTVNIPISTDTSDNEFYEYFQQIILPIIKEYDPIFMFISAGYDILQGDPVGLMSITGECLNTITRELIQLMNSKNVLMALEGGYNPDIVAEAVCQGVMSLIELTNLSNLGPSSDDLSSTDELKDLNTTSLKKPKASWKPIKKPKSKDEAKKSLLLRANIRENARYLSDYWLCMRKLVYNK